MRDYIDLNTIYTDHQFGEFKIISNIFDYGASEKIKNRYNVTDEYKNFSNFYLFKNEDLIMCSTETELIRYSPFIKKSFGDVLLIGIGLGMVVFPFLDDPSITSITIVDNEPELISYVGSKIKEKDIQNKVTILNGDGYELYNDSSHFGKYDTVLLDFWTTITKDTLDDVFSMKNNYLSFLKDERSIIMSWCEDIKDLLIESFNP